MLLIDEIFLSSDTRKEYFAEEPKGLTDVVVKFNSGEKFFASFFTFDKVIEMRKEHQLNEKFLSGRYFWAKNMILIEACDKATIERVIENLLEEGEFREAFTKI